MIPPKIPTKKTKILPTPTFPYFGEEPPVRTTLQADLPGFAIEVDAVLYKPAE